MTVIAMYRFDDSAIFVSDFRTTLGDGTQYDVMLKFIDYDKRLGLFLSGDVGFWKSVLPKVENRLSEITLGNIDDPDGPFREELRFGAYTGLERSRARALGFIIEGKNNRIFQVDLTPGGAAIWEEIPQYSGVVIGSGGHLYRIQARIENAARHTVMNFGMDYYRIADSVRREIGDCMRDAGAGSYMKLGVSPYMCLSSLVGGHFMIRGEEVEGTQYDTDGPSRPFSYQFIRKTDHTLVLRDLIEGVEHKVYNFNTSDDVDNYEVFDPERKTLPSFDITETLSEKDHVFLFHQWVTYYKEDEMYNVYRSVKKIEFIEVPGRRKIQKGSAPIISHRDFPSPIGERYIDCRDVYIELNPDKEEEFEKDMDESLLFDDSWLANHIFNYYSTFLGEM
ncbi:hypothetical protein G9G63_25730 [Paenibacillus sp. EKM202P]|uniref:hypothetical protein n=1 Tax=unclassified Paenibacillus TaxID=185978 RepID=UPI0013EB470A|nr:MULTISPECIES: hypothetical protein [unclassified Paenibacillus]KAF6558331.1 hypothetical protein G9G63_25730 [Paenibacillus sp. EKM202P]KAF6563265.1 hypothetical protein G9G64_25620 [Paenibacillus sp. EKM207P]